MKKLLLFLSLLLSVSLFLSGCGEKKTQETKTGGKLTVYTTVYPLQFFTQQIGGDAVKVETIYPPGADEHTFEPTQQDMMKLADADLFIYVGLGLEGFVEKTKESLKNEKVTFLAAGDAIQFEENAKENKAVGSEHAADETKGHTEEELAHDETGKSADEEHVHAHGDIDPHVWLDPVYSMQMAEMIKDELIKQMPEKEEQFIKNYNTLSLKLAQIDDKFADIGKNAKDKKILVSHAAFGYWEKRYGIEQISIAGLSTSSEPSQKDLAGVIDTAKAHHLKYIFFEQNVSSKLTETVQKEIGADALTLHNLSTLTAKDLKNNEDYYTLMQHNIDVLKKALLK
ncbi:metal ABC transporter solute-binding protein, Zn/Mn family [Bacillus benzoevorans]|uniref:Zinc transport system substrate-binding protein n=1 Tax=Bacillus benzoevorans TaxID=1456 RepID=A0A7X0HS47_9BACI|nr:zinc ABC transporter substrate-binding protein [Bacillus benzoevorans]MBB6445808.1 zinc transport system substrate-binding protein [Bacillus benzoevorans]